MTTLPTTDPGQSGVPFRPGLSQLGAPPAAGPPKVEVDPPAEPAPEPELPNEEI